VASGRLPVKNELREGLSHKVGETRVRVS
jgi:hypothetical protein